MKFEQDFQSLIELVSNVTDAFTAGVFLPSPAEGMLSLRIYHTLSDHLTTDARIARGQGLVGWVAEHGEPLNSVEFKHDISALGLYSGPEDIKSFMAVPIRTPEGTGVLCIDSKRQYVFTPKVQKILLGFSRLISYLLENSDVYRQIGRGAISLSDMRDYARALTHSCDEEAFLDSACNLPKKLLDYDACLIALRAPGEDRFEVARCICRSEDPLEGRPVDVDRSLVGWVLSHGEVLHLQTLSRERGKSHLIHPEEPAWPVASFLGLPLRVAEDFLGVLAFTRWRPGGFLDRELAAAELVQHLLSLGLANTRMHAKWRSLAEVDRLTGLPNYRRFRTHLRAALERTAEQKGFLALLAVEAVEFPDPGREAWLGDGLLKELALLHRQFAEDPDLVTCFQGQRFLLALEGASPEAARTLAERLREVVEETIFPSQGPQVRLRAHIGLSSFPEDGRTEGQLVLQGLRALEWAKEEGRNTICSCAEVME